MNVPVKSAARPLAQPNRQADPPRVQLMLGRSEAMLLGAIEDLEPWPRGRFQELCSLVEPHATWLPRPEKAAAALAMVDEAALAARIRAQEAALAAAPDRNTARGLIGLLVGAFPNARPLDLDVYRETLLHDAMALGFPPTAVAGACRHLRRTVNFLPTVSEFIAAGAEYTEGLKRGLELDRRVAGMMDRAHQSLAAQEAS